ncbi:uncharacterized protein LOC131371143 isoform X2 [Hemibagrus wyckioides]|uniref:uncharacterized protein LOC131371143 isoform X2 n=1 Tax=Hemibagrus wyckioides TaxID=337641 RepID=UPI00266C49F6|nr:uncharacterized protein LOC131371143 isoform X2 [Hemibagrus wyckioides]
MKQNKHIYSNVTSISERGEAPGSGKRCYCLMISLSVLLFLSLIANGLLTYFYLKLKCPLDAHTLPEQDRNHSAGDCKLKNVTVTSHKQIRRCSAGERQIQYKDRLYIFPADEMSWISSREKCQELGGDLVIINSKQEHASREGLAGPDGPPLKVPCWCNEHIYQFSALDWSEKC